MYRNIYAIRGSRPIGVVVVMFSSLSWLNPRNEFRVQEIGKKVRLMEKSTVIRPLRFKGVILWLIRVRNF